MSEKICLHWIVSGRVQGVWFRASTKDEADKLGLKGWVRNLSDGRVEVVACGDKKTINRLHEWLKHGPRLAKVTELIFEEYPLDEFKDFAVR